MAIQNFEAIKEAMSRRGMSMMDEEPMATPGADMMRGEGLPAQTPMPETAEMGAPEQQNQLGEDMSTEEMAVRALAGFLTNKRKKPNHELS